MAEQKQSTFDKLLGTAVALYTIKKTPQGGRQAATVQQNAVPVQNNIAPPPARVSQAMGMDKKYLIAGGVGLVVLVLFASKAIK